jgi:ketosteroid isomerase-like protein
MPVQPQLTSYPRLRQLLNMRTALSGLLALSLAMPVMADDAADVIKLTRAGQYAEALARADAALAQRPRDAQMRFLKGVALAEHNKPAEAITVFTRLTEDFPDLPEPYNNLAVLYAAGGQYEKARTALDKAIRTNPAYATAYENLGDIHAKLASQAYEKALQIDTRNPDTKSKLALVRNLNSYNGTFGEPKSAAALAAVSQPAPASAKPTPPTVVAAAPAPKSVPPVAAPPVATPPVVAPPVAAAVPAPKPAAPAVAAAPSAAGAVPAGPASKPPVAAAKAVPPVVVAANTARQPDAASRSEAASARDAKRQSAKTAAEASAKKQEKDDSRSGSRSSPEQAAVLAAVSGWAKAWSAKDVNGYLAYYASDFDTPKGVSRKAWSEEREARIVGKGRIDVTVESPQVVVDGNTATVKFRQIYLSDRLTAKGRKTLVLVKQRGKWQIQQERTGA